MVSGQAGLDGHRLPFELVVPRLLGIRRVHTGQHVGGRLVTPIDHRAGRVYLFGRVPVLLVQKSTVPLAQRLASAVRVPYTLAGEFAQAAGPVYVIGVVQVLDQWSSVHVPRQLIKISPGTLKRSSESIPGNIVAEMRTPRRL